MSHGRTVCRTCGTVMLSCRCMESHATTYSICDSCKSARQQIADSPESQYGGDTARVTDLEVARAECDHVRAQLTSALTAERGLRAECERLRGELAGIVSTAESLGWNGVENSKILIEWMKGVVEERKAAEARVAELEAIKLPPCLCHGKPPGQCPVDAHGQGLRRRIAELEAQLARRATVTIQNSDLGFLAGT